MGEHTGGSTDDWPTTNLAGQSPHASPWRVFLSHTSDLRQYPVDRSFVTAAEAAVVRAGHAVADMGYFNARAGQPAAYCERMVARSNVYVGIIGLRYGSPVPGGNGLSYTQFEFEIATDLGIPRLIFLVRDDTLQAGHLAQPVNERLRQDAFRKLLCSSDLTAAWIASPGELEIALHQSLVELEAESSSRLWAPPPSLLAPAAMSTNPARLWTPTHTGDDAVTLPASVWVQLDQPAIGRAIELMRQHFKLTRIQLVECICEVSDDEVPGVDPSLVYRWERGERGRPGPRPGERYRRLLGMVCERGLQKLSPTTRREFLHQLSILAGPIATALSGNLSSNVALNRQHIDALRLTLDHVIDFGVGDAGLADWEQTVLTHGRATRDRPPALMLADLAADLDELGLALQTCRSSPVRRDLTRALSQMAGLMVLTFVNLNDRVGFRTWARTARITAREAGDTATYSWVRAQEAYGHYYSDDFANAIAVAQDAQRLAKGMPCVGAALAAALEGRAHAALGSLADTRRALDRAESIVSRLPAEQLVPSAFGYNEAQLRFHESNALTNLRDTRHAWEAQERALALSAPYDYTDRIMTHLDRAICMLNEGDPSGAAAYALQTFTSITESQRKGIITMRARDFLAGLPAPARSLPAARDLRDLTIDTIGDQD